MSDRLRQIWGGFEETTTRRLTGSGIDGVEVPPRRDFAADLEADLSDGIAAPAEAAFTELKHRLSAAEQRAAKKQARKRRKRSGGRGDMADYTAAPPAPLSADALPDGAPKAAQELIKGLKATEARIERSGSLYTVHMAAAQGRSTKRKKFFGLF